MRWVEHWTIGKDVMGDEHGLFFLLGCIMPDWFERHPIHRTTETFEMIVNRAEKLRYGKGIKHEWQLGTVVHFICDYCTQAHNEEYYDLYKHRVYEVMAQKYFKRQHKEDKTLHLRVKKIDVPPALMDKNISSAMFENELHKLIEDQLKELHKRIAELESPKWYRDSKVMELDIIYSYKLVYALKDIFSIYGKVEQ